MKGFRVLASVLKTLQALSQPEAREEDIPKAITEWIGSIVPRLTDEDITRLMQILNIDDPLVLRVRAGASGNTCRDCVAFSWRSERCAEKHIPIDPDGAACSIFALTRPQPEAREDIADSCFEAAHAMPRPEALRFITSLIATHCDKSQTVTQRPQPAPKPETDGGALLPCPFCGATAKRIDISDEAENRGGSVISCTKCLASTKVFFGEKVGLEEAWNTRAALASHGQGERTLRVCGNCLHGRGTSLDDTRCYKATPYLPTGRHCEACADWEPCGTCANPKSAALGQSAGEPKHA